MAFQDESAVKSARRVFEILEWFGVEQRPAGATRIAQGCGMPVSSMVALLKSMTYCGYLRFDVERRTYFPTAKVSRMGHWLDSKLVRRGTLRDMAAQIMATTGETVTISCRNDLDMLYVSVTPHDDVNPEPRAGDLAPLFRSAVGLSALSRNNKADVRKLVQRYNRSVYRLEQKADLDEILRRVADIRTRGYYAGYDLYKPNLGAIAWPVRPKDGSHEMVLAVGGRSARLRGREQQIICAAQAVIRAHEALYGS